MKSALDVKWPQGTAGIHIQKPYITAAPHGLNSCMLFKLDVSVCLYTILVLQLVFWKWTPKPSKLNGGK